KNQLLIARTSFCKETYFRGQSISMPEGVLTTDRENSYQETRKLLEETFSTTEFCLQPVEFAGQLFGFIMAIHFSEKLEKYLQKAARYISLSLRNLQLESFEPAKTVESETGLALGSQKFFVELSKEISRSRRIQK